TEEIDVWALWSRSAASAWPRRSTASCCVRPESSAVVSASNHGGRTARATSVVAPHRRDTTEAQVDVLVTGISRNLGARLAARLAEHPEIGRVVGVDTMPPNEELQAILGDRVEVITGDIRTVMATVATRDPETVVHLGVMSTPGRAGRAAMKEYNIIGTMQLLAACQAAPGLRKVVVRSSTAAYGASFRDPAVFTESMPPTLMPRGGFAKDIIEIEGYVRGFARRRP